MMNNKHFFEYEKVFNNKNTSINIADNALQSVENTWNTDFWIVSVDNTPDGFVDTELLRIECGLLVIMNCLLGNSTPAYDCSDELRIELEKTELGQKINQMTEYLLPLPLMQWGDLSTNPDTRSTIFDVEYDVRKVAEFYKQLGDNHFKWIKSEFDLEPQHKGTILCNYIQRKLDDAIAEQEICLAQVEMKNLTDETYKKILETDSPLVIIYKDLLAIVKTLIERAK